MLGSMENYVAPTNEPSGGTTHGELLLGRGEALAHVGNTERGFIDTREVAERHTENAVELTRVALVPSNCYFNIGTFYECF